MTRVNLVVIAEVDFRITLDDVVAVDSASHDIALHVVPSHLEWVCSVPWDAESSTREGDEDDDRFALSLVGQAATSADHRAVSAAAICWHEEIGLPALRGAMPVTLLVVAP